MLSLVIMLNTKLILIAKKLNLKLVIMSKYKKYYTPNWSEEGKFL